MDPKRKGKKLCTVDDRARVVIVVVAVHAFGIVSILYIPENKNKFCFKKKLAIGGAHTVLIPEFAHLPGDPKTTAAGAPPRPCAVH
jgi:hypothetical protein